jgi:lantibiotic modifying enzyme
LFELHRASSDAGFLRTARAALGHAMSCFDAQARNWPDRRSLAQPASADTAAARSSLQSFMTAWCSGAPGVSLALSSCAAADAGAQVQQQFDAALQTTLASVAPQAGERLQPQSFCLCHGTAGNADILLQLALHTGRDDLREAALAAAEAGLRKHHAAGNWPCGIRDGGQSPGLMLGLSGIGHFYLRLHDQTIATVL